MTVVRCGGPAIGECARSALAGVVRSAYPSRHSFSGKATGMKDALDVHRSLLAREVPHEVIRLPRVVLSADEIPDALELPPERCVAVRMYRADEQVAAVIVRAGATAHPG